MAAKLSTQLSFRVDEDTFKILSYHAAKDRRKVGEYMRLMIEDLISKGIIPPIPKDKQ